MRSTWTPLRVTQVRPRNSPAGADAASPSGRRRHRRPPSTRRAVPPRPRGPGASKKSMATISARRLRRRTSVAALASAPVSRPLPRRVAAVCERARLTRERGVVRSRAALKRPSMAASDRPSTKRASQTVASPAAGDDLPAHPLEVLEGLVAARQDVDGVLDRHRAQRLQTPPDLHPQVAGRGRDLVDEDEPPRRGRFGHAGVISQLNL